MTDFRSPSPAAEACLCRPYPSTQKGGTWIAEDVHDLATHEARMEHPDGYRLAACLRCGAALHAHDERPRVLRGEAETLTAVRRYRCSDRSRCGAIWRVLPGFLARCLWGSWGRVGRAVMPRSASAIPASAIPARTARRFSARLASSARELVWTLSTALDGVLADVAVSVGVQARRIDVLARYRTQRGLGPTLGVALAELAAALHRLAPGVRLM